jgi:ADP-heptose:LPS heptosyltransferase
MSIFQTSNTLYGLHMNTFDHYMKLVEAAGFKAIPYTLDFFYSDEASTRIKHFTEKPFVILNVTAGNKVKEWPEEKFVALAHHITDALKLHVIISTADTQAAADIIRQIDRGSQVLNGSGLTLEESGALYAHAKAFVGVDTGPMYIAYAVGTPVVIIMGPIDPAEQIPPLGKRVAHIPPPPGTVPWMFVARSPRSATPEQLRAARDTTVEAVIKGLDRIL